MPPLATARCYCAGRLSGEAQAGPPAPGLRFKPSTDYQPPPLLLPPELPGSQSFVEVLSKPFPPPELHWWYLLPMAGAESAPASAAVAKSSAVALRQFARTGHLLPHRRG
jgi:hypothetical protein